MPSDLQQKILLAVDQLQAADDWMVQLMWVDKDWL